MSYQHLVISGGGMKGYIALGSLISINNYYNLNKFKSYIGTSVGSLLCFLLSIGYTVEEAKQIFINIDITDYLVPDLLNIINVYGICSTENVKKILMSVGKQKNIPYDCTFKEHYKITKKKLVITGSNINTQKTEIFSKDKTPNMSIYTALLISIALPLLFQPIKYNGFFYVDGGTYLNYPIEISDDINQTLGIILGMSRTENINDFMKYIGVLMGGQGDSFNLYNKYKDRTIDLSIIDVNSINFDYNMLEKHNMLTQGYEETEKFFLNKFRLMKLKVIFNKIKKSLSSSLTSVSDVVTT